MSSLSHRSEVGAPGGLPAAMVPSDTGRPGRDSASSCCSSIGKNSDFSAMGSVGSAELEGEPEVQSALKGPLDTMDALGDSLPFMQGISLFSGKSKSFTSLADVSSAFSPADLTKPENVYTRKRKIFLAFCGSWEWDRHHGDPPGGTPKRPANSSRSTFSSTWRSCDSSSDAVLAQEPTSWHCSPQQDPNCKPCGSSCCFSVRSFSLTDLRSASTCSCSSSSSSPGGAADRIR